MIATLATPPACSAPYVMAQMHSAVGGDAWDRIGETSAEGRVTTSGLNGTARYDADLSRGRYSRRFNVVGMGATAEVYDGATIWAQDISGGVHPYDTPFARERAITSAYLTRRAYFDPHSGATFMCLGTRADGSRSVTVIRVQPRGGIPADLAIDSQTHLLASVGESVPLSLDNGVTRYDDYRRVDGVVLPFAISQGTPTTPADGYTLRVTRYRLQPAAADPDFAKPMVSGNARMIGGAASSTVKMQLEGRQLIVWASIDGRAPMPFILDTGGHAILTTLAAKSLGLQARGAGSSGGSGSGTIATQYARVASARIGDAELLDQSFLVIPYPYSFYERGKKQPLAGILGLEFFERFAVRLDYGDHTVTFTPLASYRHVGQASANRLMFEDQEDMPVVGAAADGHPGLFGTDTGNAGIPILFGDFLKRTGLLAQYTGGVKTLGQGTGGSNAGRRVKLRNLRVGQDVLHDVDSNFTQMTSGSFSSHTEAGNIGFAVLSRFIPTFDYANQTLYLDPASRVTPFGVNRAGLHFAKTAPEELDVMLVDPGSAAASAGIVAGDRITAVNGNDVSNYSWADFTAIVGEPRGTKLLLRVTHTGTPRDIALVLR